jgi:hypothetical protein
LFKNWLCSTVALALMWWPKHILTTFICRPQLAWRWISCSWCHVPDSIFASASVWNVAGCHISTIRSGSIRMNKSRSWEDRHLTNPDPKIDCWNVTRWELFFCVGSGRSIYNI